MNKLQPSARVVVVGTGLTCALGRTVPAVMQALQASRSGLVFHDVHGYPTAVGRVSDSLDTGNFLLPLDRGVALALDAVSQMPEIPDAKSARAAVYWGVGIAGAQTLQSSFEQYCAQAGQAKLSSWTVPMIMPNAAASLIAQRYQFKAGAITLANACASSAMAIGQAFQAIRSNTLDMAIVGGSDAMLEPAILHAWARMRVLAKTEPAQAAHACRPFDADRNGLCLAEGAAAMLLMRADWAQTLGLEPLGEIMGYGQSCDATDLVAPDYQGQWAAMQHALDDAGLSAQQLAYVSAHATATPKGDACEWQALRSLFQHQKMCPIASLKSALGHTMGASGAVATTLTLAMLQQGWFAPTLHLHNPIEQDTTQRTHQEPHQALLAGQGVHIPDAQYALVNAFGFGGSNASLVLKK